MKTPNLYPLAALLLLGSCMTDDVVDESRQEIEYHVTADNRSRAVDSYSPTNLPGKFQVWAKTAEGKSYFGPDEIRNENGGWIDKTASRYWPKAENLSFYGIVNLPEDVKFYYEDTGSEKMNPYIHGFSVNDAVEDQIDLMYAVADQVPYSTSGVPMNFHHALSQVSFRARNNTTNLTITISEVVVGDLYKKGNYTMPSATTVAGGGPTGGWDFNPPPKSDNSTDTDDNSYSSKVKYSVTLGNSVELLPVTLDEENASGEGDTYNLTGPTEKNDNDWSKVLTLIPQTQKAWDPTIKGESYNGAYFKLRVLIEDQKDASGNGVQLYDDYAVIPAEINWEEGKRYVYTFIFDKNTNGGYTDTPDDPQPVLATVTYQVSVEDFIVVDDKDENMHDPDVPAPPTPDDPKTSPGVNIVAPPDAEGVGY